MARHTHSRVSRGKVLLTLAVVAAGATAVGAGTYASFTASTTAGPLTVQAGTEALSVPAAGANNRMTVNASGIVPGDTMQRAVNLINSGNQNLNAITLTTNATTSSLLDTDATNGLQLVIDKCSQAWTEAGTAPAYTYTCGGTQTNIIASRAVIGSGLAMSGLSALTAAQTDYLRVKLTFPATAGDTFQGLSSTINFTFNGTQRTAGNA
jgi:predicted ribosomally synthesized peptide with SipW-like signal peptide